MCNGNCDQGRKCDCCQQLSTTDETWIHLIMLAAVIAAALVALLYCKLAEAKPSYDERKQAVLSERKAVRRATERAYETCLQRPSTPAKCLAESLKAGEKALANWRSAGHNPHTFSTY